MAQGMFVSILVCFVAVAEGTVASRINYSHHPPPQATPLGAFTLQGAFAFLAPKDDYAKAFMRFGVPSSSLSSIFIIIARHQPSKAALIS